MAERAEIYVGEDRGLKRLGFVQAAVLTAAAWLSTLYEFAKENSGPLRPGVNTVEETVKTVVGPVYDKIDGKPSEVLQFVDEKVYKAVDKLARNVPQAWKERSYQVYGLAKQAPDAARSLVTEFQRTGLIATANETAKNLYGKCEPTARQIYNKYEPVAEEYAALAWHKLLELPLFPQLVEPLTPAAIKWSEKYNDLVLCLANRHYRLADFLPSVPTEKMEKALKRGSEREAEPAPAAPPASAATQ